MNSLSARHSALFDKSWLRPIPMSGLLLAFTLAFGIVAILCNVMVRQDQYDIWAASPQTTTLNDVVLFSTTDAAYFLKAAEIAKSDGTFNDHLALRHYPNVKRQTAITPYPENIRSFPLLSIMIAHLASSDTINAIVSTAHQLIPITAGITALAVIFAFGVTGYWLEGCAAAIGGCLSASYLVRSSAGRIDTDQLNLGFMYLLMGLIILASKSKTWKQYIFLCIAVGSISYLFMWWYDRSQLIWFLITSLVWMTLALRRNMLLALVGAVIVIGLSGATVFNPFGSIYLATTIEGGEFLFPNTYDTITEISRVSLVDIFRQVTGSVEMGLLCVVGLGLWTLRHPATAIAFAPLMLFGLLNFVIGNRAIFYSAPIMWFGGAFLISLLCRFVFTSITTGINVRQVPPGVLAATVAILIAWSSSPHDYTPRPTFSPNVVAGFTDIRQKIGTGNGVVATWWDYGYVATMFSGLPTLHDGGSQSSPVTHFVARSFLEPNQEATIGIFKFLATSGLAKMETHTAKTLLNEEFNTSATAPSPDLYLVVTNQMTGWISSISKIGNWDIEQGEPVQLRGNPDGAEVHYKPINCRFNAYPQQLDCNGVRIDLERGLIDGQPLLVGWAHTQDGNLLRRRDFDHDADHAIQIVQNGGRISAYFLHHQLYESTFNKLYYQGLMEHPSISLHYDDYPHIRIYKVDGTPTM